MALTKMQKEDLLSRYESSVALAPHAFVLGYQGITVPQVTELRARLRENGAQYEVVKNTLLRRAVDGRPLGCVKNAISGPVAIAYSYEDPVALAKALTDFGKTAPMLQFRAGVVEGQAVPADQIKEIAELPTREVLIAKLFFLMQSPVSRFVSDLAAVIQGVVVVLDQVAQKKS